MILHGRRRAAEALHLAPHDRALEIGCGTGLNFRYLLDYLDPHEGQLTGVDFSADMLAKARRRVAARGWHNVDLVEADATTLDLGRTFQGVYFGYSLTMIPDWQRALRRAADHLAPGGRLVVLDFGDFKGWGPLGPVMRTWLRANHVETLRPYVAGLKELFPRLEVTYWLGGYNFTAIGRRSA
jgi:ubiquinone/menaquinone biosynthesis C-methylase UbiE